MTDEIANTKELEIEIKQGTKCPECLRVFASEQAYRMHHIRVHTEAGKRGYTWRRDKSRESELERKRIYQRKLRARYKTEGKTSQGKPKVRFPSGDPDYKKRKYQEMVVRFHSMGLNSHGKPFRRMGRPPYKYKSRSRIEPIVYGAPDTSTTEAPKNKVHFCPFCGEDIERIINL